MISKMDWNFEAIDQNISNMYTDASLLKEEFFIG